MKNSSMSGLTIRTALVRRPDLGYIYACDLKRELSEEPHAIIFKWKAGSFERGECNYDAHSVCEITEPGPGLVDISGAGYYTVNSSSGKTSADIIENSHPAASTKRVRGFRSVATIAGNAYAVGLRGMVYRMDNVKSWIRIDEGLPDTFDVLAITGLDSSDLYAVGRHGEAWHYNGKGWSMIEMPTSVTLECARALPDGRVFVGGDKGVLIEGTGSRWTVVSGDTLEDDIWDIEWFRGDLYVSTSANVFRLEANELVPVDFGEDKPSSCYQLSAAEGVMWSNGQHDLMSFDGKTWTRVV